MKRHHSGNQTVAMLCAMACVAVANSLSAATVDLRVGTRDEFPIDLDGTGTETPGDLGLTSKPVMLSGAQVPPDFQLAGVTDFTVTFDATGGNLSADQGNFVEFTGLGVARQGETAAETSNLTANTSESLTVSLTSNGAPLWIAGVDIFSWRNAHPVSAVTFVGATVGGASTITGGPSITDQGRFLFDTPVLSFSMTNSSASDGLRLGALIIGDAIPEPASMAMIIVLCGAVACRRSCRRHCAVSSRRSAQPTPGSLVK